MGGQGALLTVAGTLAAVMAWEIVNMPRSDVTSSRPYDPVVKHEAPRVHADDVQAWVRPILARPLFSPDRRPAARTEDVAARVTGPPRLTGILVGPFGRSAIFAGDGSKPIVLGEGGRIDAYKVRSIAAAEVQLDGPNGMERLQPAFDAADRQVSAPSGATRHTGEAAHSK